MTLLAVLTALAAAAACVLGYALLIRRDFGDTFIDPTWQRFDNAMRQHTKERTNT